MDDVAFEPRLEEQKGWGIEKAGIANKKEWLLQSYCWLWELHVRLVIGLVRHLGKECIRTPNECI